MAVSLQKGQKVSLTKGNDGLSQLIVGLGWDQAEKPKGLFARKPRNIDCDASAILLRNGHFMGKKDIVYFGHLSHESGAVIHKGDNLTGEGEGDDEQIFVDLSRVPADVDRIVIVVNIYQGAARGQHFGMIRNAFIRIVDGRNNSEMLRYSLTDDYSGMLAMLFGEIYRNGTEWKFNALGQGTVDNNIAELANRFV